MHKKRITIDHKSSYLHKYSIPPRYTYWHDCIPTFVWLNRRFFSLLFHLQCHKMSNVISICCFIFALVRLDNLLLNCVLFMHFLKIVWDVLWSGQFICYDYRRLAHIHIFFLIFWVQEQEFPYKNPWISFRILVFEHS